MIGGYMIAVSIEKLTRGKYKVVTDQDISILLYYKEMKALEIKEGLEIRPESWEKALEILFIRGKKRVYHLLGRQDYTSQDVRKKLLKDGYTEVMVEEIIDYFLDKGFIDDLRFVEKYYDYYKKQKSQRMIKMKLREKGIDSGLLKEFFQEHVNAETEFDTAAILLQKKYGNKEFVREDYIKMVRFLANKGFDYDVSKITVEALFKKNDL